MNIPVPPILGANPHFCTTMQIIPQFSKFQRQHDENTDKEPAEQHEFTFKGIQSFLNAVGI